MVGCGGFLLTWGKTSLVFCSVVFVLSGTGLLVSSVYLVKLFTGVCHIVSEENVLWSVLMYLLGLVLFGVEMGEAV